MDDPLFDWVDGILGKTQKSLDKLKEALSGFSKGECKKCGGEGVIEVPDGPDDFAHSFCDCEEGRSLERDYRWGE